MSARYKIGVFGSADGKALNDPVVRTQCELLGKELAAHGCIVITGACAGVPYAVAEAAHAMGANVWGFTPAKDAAEHTTRYPEQERTLYEKLIFVPSDIVQMDDAVRRKYRNVMSTAHCDAGIIVSGRWGTMHEFCSLYDYGKVVGVLTGTGGIADELSTLMQKIHKKSNAEVIFHGEPHELMELMMTQLTERAGV